jgi:hypothetical protein
MRFVRAYLFSAGIATIMHLAALAYMARALKDILCDTRAGTIRLFSKCLSYSDHLVEILVAILVAALLSGIAHMLNTYWPRSRTAAFYLPVGMMAGFGAVIWTPLFQPIGFNLGWGGLAYLGFFTLPYMAGVLGMIWLWVKNS